MNHPPDYGHLTWIGTILRPHGLKGELRVRPLTDTPDYYLQEKEFLLESGEGLKRVEVLEIQFHQDNWLIRLSGLETRDQAQALKGRRLLIADTRLRPLDEDEFFLHRLPGCRVYDQHGEDFGIVVRGLETGANLVYEVEYQGKEFLIPDAPGVVLELDLETRKLVIDPVPGLFDDDEVQKSHLPSLSRDE